MSHGNLLAVCADGGAGVGSGHLARCLALVQAWRDDGGAAVLLTNGNCGWFERYEAESATVQRIDELSSLDPVWLIIDGYRFGSSESLAARARGAHVLVVDDHGLGQAGPADSLLDQNLGATAHAYRDRVGADGLLLGPLFALLRREFVGARREAEARHAPSRVGRVLLSMGGDPPASVVDLFETIARSLARDHEIRWLRGKTDVTDEMLQADLAVAASGSTCWEFCCLGLPAALVSTTDNQRPIAAALGRAGIALDLGTHERVNSARAVNAVRALSEDAARRQGMAEAGRALVDGRGARRVVAHLRGRLLALRPVAHSDARLLWRWVNDPAARAAAFDTTPIPWEDHERWLRRKLIDSGCTMYMAEAAGAGPVGQIRFDHIGDRAEIDVAVAPEHRGEGWGPAVIDAGVRAFLRDGYAVAVDARVKPGNEASERSFDAAGFEFGGLGTGDGDRWLRYVRPSHDAL